MTAVHRQRTMIPLERLTDAARRRAEPWVSADWTLPIDATKPFTCDTLTPLFYTPSFVELSPAQRLRYNQLAAMACNEVITFFEESLAGTVLASLERQDKTPLELRDNLAAFQTEEAEHTATFRRLNRAAAPDWYAATDHAIVRIPTFLHRAIRVVGSHPMIFPFIFWVMLAMEEHSLEISRRYAALEPENIESHFAAVYRDHMKDEARHVQIDWHLIERYYASASRPIRMLNARLFALTLRRYLLTPRRAARQVLALLTVEFPELRPRLPQMLAQLAALAGKPDYHRMMFSSAATPITFRLLDKFSEFRSLRRTLLCYAEFPGEMPA